MLKNYLIVAIHNLLKNKLYSFINIAGLAIGIASCILISSYVRYELSYDKQYDDVDRVYRVSRNYLRPDGTPGARLAPNVPVAADMLKENFNDIELIARLAPEPVVVRRDDRFYYEEGFRFADSEIFKIFQFEWVQGDPNQALHLPFSVVMTQSMKRKYFGSEEAMGKTLLIDNKFPMTVTGIIEDLPGNTHLTLDAIASLTSAPAVFGENYLNGWGNNNFHTYFRLVPGGRVKLIEAELPALLARQLGSQRAARISMSITHLPDIHLGSSQTWELKSPGSLMNVYAFSAVATCILLIGCINFINLSTARSTQRAREVGMRRSLGAMRSQLVLQFLLESILLAAVAMLLALVMVEIFLLFFSEIIGKDLTLQYSNPLLFAALLIFTFFIGMIAGIYPAFFLSAYKPVSVLRGEVTRGGAGVRFRNILVVAQFTVSIALIIFTSVVYLQLNFAHNIELGFNKEQIVIMESSPRNKLGGQWRVIKSQLLMHTGIVQAAASVQIPSENNLYGTVAQFEGGDKDGLNVGFMTVDFDFFKTYEINLVAGRAFDQTFGTDRMTIPLQDPDGSGGAAYIINETAAKQMGWSAEQAIDKWLQINIGGGDTRGPVIGVVDDVYYGSIRNRIRPMVYFVPPENPEGFPDASSLIFSNASVKINGHDIQDSLKHIDKVWRQFMPDQPINRRFLDLDFQVLYQQEDQQGQIFALFTLFTIITAGLGLYGLAAFSIDRRTREISLRKVMGAKVRQIVRLLVWQFSKPVVIANLLAWPIAVWGLLTWLERFPYRIENWLLLPFCLLAGLLALLIAWATVFSNVRRVAKDNPIHALRYE